MERKQDKKQVTFNPQTSVREFDAAEGDQDDYEGSLCSEEVSAENHICIYDFQKVFMIFEANWIFELIVVLGVLRKS